MFEVTILTPTYNRVDTLRRCYDSLLQQTNQNFKWIIVDDGSIDDTKSLVESFIKEKIINIIYMYKKNEGKHTALNYGIKQIDTEITFILDSDDYLTNDSVEQILFYHNKYRQNKKLCGYTFLKVFSDGKINGQNFPVDEEISSFIDRRINGNILGDKCEVFYTRCLKEYPFPQYEGEKFLGESTVWVPMALKYDMVHINKGIYVGDYLVGGLTNQGKKMRISCPNGGMENSKVHMIKQCNLLSRIKSAILYNCYGFFADKTIKDIIMGNDYRIITISTMPIGYLVHEYWRYKYK